MIRVQKFSDSGDDMHRWARDLWPLNRSLTGDGVRETLGYIQKLLPELVVYEVETGTRAFDWIVPDEWNLREAWVEDETGKRIIDTAWTNLHIVGYSEPFDGLVSREELEKRLYSLPNQPTAIPYVTSYYERTWGFCIADENRRQLSSGPFRVYIDTTLQPGHLTYADLVIPGKTREEVLLTSYVCHPSLANNELSGPVVITALARWIATLRNRRFTYRVVFAPETIGAILYMSRHLEHLRLNVKAGWVATCMGDERTYSYIPSRSGGTLADRVSLQVLANKGGFTRYTFLDRGSDERQWCSPGADLPVCSVRRSKTDAYAEYHTSLDDLENVVTPAGLQGGYDVLQDCVRLMEANKKYIALFPGEPQMSRRGLRSTTSIKNNSRDFRAVMDVIAYCDGINDVIDLCEHTKLSWEKVVDILEKLLREKVITYASDAV